MSIVDSFTFLMKADDKNVVKKLDEIQSKAKVVEGAVDGVNDGLSDLGNEMKSAISQAIPGSERLLGVLGKLGTAARSAVTTLRSAGMAQDVADANGSGRLNLRRGASKPTAPAASGGTGLPSVPVRVPVPAPGVAGAVAGGAGAGGAAGGAGAAGAGAAAAAGMTAVGVAASAAAAALALVVVGAGVLAKAFFDGVETLKKSRDAARDAGVTNTQMAATEQFAKSMRLDKEVAQNALKEIARTTQEGWVKSRERGNIFGIGNEQTQMLKSRGIRTTDGNGELRNSTAIFEDIGKKMKTMSRDNAIAFGEFFGMTKDFAAGVYDSKQSLSEFAQANKESIAAQAEAMVNAKKYEQAQQALANAWDDFSIQIGGKLLPIMTDLLNAIVEASNGIAEFGTAVQGQIMMIRDTAASVFDWLRSKASAVTDFIFGAGTSDKVGDAVGAANAAIVDTVGNALNSVGDAFSAGMQRSRDYANKDKKPTDQAAFDREMNKQTSLNAKSANIQLEAANMMKTATAKFGLSTEQYMAMWAATSGKESGLRDSGGMTTSGFRDAYKDVTSKYASPEAAVALYGKGQPMMQQLPQQYAMGMGVNQYGLPSNGVGLGRAAPAMEAAKAAVQSTSAPVGPAASPFGGDKSKRGSGGNTIDLTMGDVNIYTKSTDPNEINSAVTGGMMDNLKFALNKIGTGEIA